MFYRPDFTVKSLMFCKKESRVGSQLSADARMLKTRLSKLRDMCYFMIDYT